MMRLIDADVLTEGLCDGEVKSGGDLLMALFKVVVDATPTVDAVPVCRCEDYKFGTNDPTGIVICRMASYPNYAARDPNWYCADGERKGGDE